jgi:hypothetical protein
LQKENKVIRLRFYPHFLIQEGDKVYKRQGKMGIKGKRIGLNLFFIRTWYVFSVSEMKKINSGNKKSIFRYDKVLS